MSDETLIQRSRTALVARFPYLAPVLDQAPATQPIRDQDGVVDIALGTGRYYGTDARAYARRQVAAALEQPHRIRASFPTPPDDDDSLYAALIRGLTGDCRRLGVEPAALPLYPLAPPGFLIVVGIGLGYHLPLLVAQVPARCLILADTHPEFLRHALGAIDWQALFQRLDANGQSLRLVLAESPETLNTLIGKAINQEGVLYLDGATLFLHHPTPPQQACFRQLRATVGMAFATRGFFEDECLMIRNAAANLDRYGFTLIDGQARPPRTEPVLVIGSGPSLAQDLEQIKALRNRTIVFSCGTALRPCLLAGIVPDYHVELENHPHLYDILSEANTIHDISDIHFIASVTVDPAASALFRSISYFFRETTVSSQAFADPADILSLAQPMVANAAVRTAAALGFRNITLFGVDCGSRDPGTMHIAGTAYEFQPGIGEHTVSLEVPANFGGVTHSEIMYLWSKKLLERAIGRFGLKVVNCSDGVRIEHTTPCRSADLTIPGRHLDRRRITGAVADPLPHYPAHHYLRPPQFERLSTGMDRLIADLRALIDAARPDDFTALSQAIRRMLAQHRDAGNPTAVIIQGSLTSFEKLACHILWRLPPGPTRTALERLWHARLRAVLDRFEHEVGEVLRTLPVPSTPVASPEPRQGV